MTKEGLARINALAAKSRTSDGLTPAEKSEQQALRSEYISEMRQSFKAQIENTDVIDENGKVTPLSQIAKKGKK